MNPQVQRETGTRNTRSRVAWAIFGILLVVALLLLLATLAIPSFGVCCWAMGMPDRWVPGRSAAITDCDVPEL